MTRMVIRLRFGAAGHAAPVKILHTDIPTREEAYRSAGLAYIADMRYLIERGPQVEHIRGTLELICKGICESPGFDTSGMASEMCRDELEDASLERLCTCIRESNAMLWREAPNYYAALLVEYELRLRQLVGHLPEP